MFSLAPVPHSPCSAPLSQQPLAPSHVTSHTAGTSDEPQQVHVPEPAPSGQVLSEVGIVLSVGFLPLPRAVSCWNTLFSPRGENVVVTENDRWASGFSASVTCAASVVRTVAESESTAASSLPDQLRPLYGQGSRRTSWDIQIDPSRPLTRITHWPVRRGSGRKAHNGGLRDPGCHSSHESLSPSSCTGERTTGTRVEVCTAPGGGRALPRVPGVEAGQYPLAFTWEGEQHTRAATPRLLPGSHFSERPASLSPKASPRCSMWMMDFFALSGFLAGRSLKKMTIHPNSGPVFGTSDVGTDRTASKEAPWRPESPQAQDKASVVVSLGALATAGTGPQTSHGSSSVRLTEE